MDGASKLQVAAQTDGHVIQTALQTVDGHQVGQGLSGVLMAAVACIDDRNGGVHRGDHRRTLFRMTHGGDVRKAADDADGVGDAFALGGGGRIGRGKADDAAAQLQHGRLKAQAGAGAWLIEQGRELFALADCGVFVRMLDDVVADRKQLINFLNGEIHRIDKMTHKMTSHNFNVKQKPSQAGGQERAEGYCAVSKPFSASRCCF